MNTITIDTDKVNATVTRPGNCKHPQAYPPIKCDAPHPSDPDCNCRWCVFHSRFNKEKESV